MGELRESRDIAEMQWGPDGWLAKGGSACPQDPAELPNLLSKDWSDGELDQWMEREGLVAVGDPGTLKERAWRVREALREEGIVNVELDGA